MKVKNMQSSRGNDIPNQFIIEDDHGRYFQSYQTIIAFVEFKTGKIYLDKSAWDYSVTTSKYRNRFLGETKKETETKIKEGVYTLSDLNCT
jgi:hypothetical protein